MVKFYEVTNPVFGKVFGRISTAFRRYTPPNVEWVDSPDKADKIVMEVVGGLEYEMAQHVPMNKLVMFQQCVQTSGVEIEKWTELWENCSAVISFHNLLGYVKYQSEMNFLCTPLGAEPSEFKYNPQLSRVRKVFTTGHVAETECIDKIFEAVKASGHSMFHTGENFGWERPYYQYMPYMTTQELSRVFNTTEYVAGLRDIEGFEAACAEGAMVGATPIVPNLPTYFHYKDVAKFVNLHTDLVEQLTWLFTHYEPLTADQIAYARDYFSWQRIMANIYNFILE